MVQSKSTHVAGEMNMTETIDWDDPESRLALVEHVGVEGYNKALEEHWAATTVDSVNGYPIRTVMTRFGRLFAVTHTDRAFTTIYEAREFASGEPTRAAASRGPNK